jgi:hypothetical protein
MTFYPMKNDVNVPVKGNKQKIENKISWHLEGH